MDELDQGYRDNVGTVFFWSLIACLALWLLASLFG